MVINFIFLLLFAGIFAIFLPNNRLNNALGAMLAFAALATALAAVSGYGGYADFSVVWNAMPNIPVILSIVPKQAGFFGASGIIILNICALYYAVVADKKSDKILFYGLILMNCVFVLSAFCAPNYIQLLAALGMSDVIVYAAINDSEAKRQYIYGNFMADFLLLCITALILGQQGSIAISDFAGYTKSWKHRDFIALILLGCIFIKSGIALFHTAYQKMATLNFSRLNFILFAATPLMGMIVLFLLQDVLKISRYSAPVLTGFSIATIIWGAFNAMINRNILRKSIYMAMFFWGLTFWAFCCLQNFSGQFFFAFLLAAYLFNISLNIIPLSKGTENTLVCNGFEVFFINICACVLYAGTWFLFAKADIYLALTGIVLFSAVSSHIFAEIYLPVRSRQRDFNYPSPLLFIPIPLALAGWCYRYFEQINEYMPAFCVWLLLWITFWFTRPLHRLSAVNACESLQKNDFIPNLYNFLILAPLKIIGRVLRLLVDFVFIERTLIVSVKHSVRFLIFVFRKLHRNRIWSGIFFTSAAIIIIVIACYEWSIK